MKCWMLALLVSLAAGCAHDVNRPDGFARFKAASSSGRGCGKLLRRLPEQTGPTWSESSRQVVESAFTQCLDEYSALQTHASSLEFLKGVFQNLDIKYAEVAGQSSARLIAYGAEDKNAEAILMVHSTELVHSQSVALGDSENNLWGQERVDVKSVGIMQLLAMTFAKKSKIPLKKNLVFIATENGQFKEAVQMFPKARLILNEGGYGFSKQNKDVFLIASEQKGGAWLKLKHKNPNRLLSHLDQLMAVFIPHEPQDFREPGKCRLGSFSTLEQKVNVIPYKVDLELSCRGVPDIQIGQAFGHRDVSFVGRNIDGVHHISLELNYPKENMLGRLSALQVAAQGLQKLNIIPFRDWSFEEPKFYKHQRTPASADFVRNVKEVYPQQSAWGDLLWELDSSGEWSQVQGEIQPDRRDGPEKMFRTSCHWTGFEATPDGAEAFMDCRLVHTGFMKNNAQPHAQAFIKQLRDKAKDPALQIDIIKGWDYVASDSKSSFVNIMKEEIQREYPTAHTSTWVSPASQMESNEGKAIPSYGFYPVLKDDFLDVKQEKSFPTQQVFISNKIYSGAISRFAN